LSKFFQAQWDGTPSAKEEMNFLKDSVERMLMQEKTDW